jgi:hypothetical protein
MPFYRRLAATDGGRAQRYKFVVVSREPEEFIGGYLASHGFTPDQIVASATTTRKLIGTPLLILVDASGRVVDCWIGWQRPDAEERILKLLEG